MGAYSINLSGDGDENAVRTAFSHLIDALNGAGSVSGALSDQSGGVHTDDMAPAETEATTDAPESVAADDDAPSSPVLDPEPVAGDPPEPSAVEWQAGDEEPAATGDAVATEPVVYDANDPDNPLNATEA